MIELNGSISLTRDGSRRLAASFSISTGELTVLIGKNGSGKSTLLDVIAGVERLDSGSIVVEPSDLPVAYAVQDAAGGLLPWRTLLSNILLPAQLHRPVSEIAQDKATSLLHEFGLGNRKDDFPYKLSEGEKQIINLIRAVCTPASVVLLDEPFASLNVNARQRAKAMLLDFASARTTILVTHDSADLAWPITRCLRVADLAVAEIGLSEAKEFLENGVPKASR